MKLIFQTLKNMRKLKNINRNKNGYQANILGTTEYEKVKQNKREQRSKSRDMSARIVKFKEEIKEGPYFICIVCNHCLYIISVIRFNDDKITVLMMIVTKLK